MSDTKNDVAWEQLFEQLDIVNQISKEGAFEITAKDINKVREARLMTKFDHKTNLPKIFLDNKLSILPITRGSYVISQFEAYKNFEDINGEINRVNFPEHIVSIDYDNITSEATAINCAYVSGILRDFTEDEALVPTVSGRMSSKTFDFNIQNRVTNNKMPITVINSQIEIDGGYEGIQSLALIEAKNSISSDFLVRQLYYPYRLWSSNIHKQVKPIFLVYSNGIYNLYEYKFEDDNNYNSLYLVKQKNYSIEAGDITLDDIINVYKDIEVIPEPEIPFPQANSFKRIINLCELLYQNNMTKDDITMNYDFDPRQTNYYTDAARYLGVVNKKREKGNIEFFLNDEGQAIFKLRYKARQLKFVEMILKHKPFYDAFTKCLNSGEIPSKNEVVRIMESTSVYGISSENTYGRRASSITGWLNWILDLQR